MTAPAWSDRVRTGAVFALAGPPAGLLGLIVTLLAAPHDAGPPPPDGWSFVAATPLLLAFAYMVGLPPALLTGVFAAAVTGWAHRPVRFAAASAAAGLVATTAYAALLKPLPAATDRPVETALRLGGVGALAAACCAGLVLAGRARAARARATGDIIIPPES